MCIRQGWKGSCFMDFEDKKTSKVYNNCKKYSLYSFCKTRWRFQELPFWSLFLPLSWCFKNHHFKFIYTQIQKRNSILLQVSVYVKYQLCNLNLIGWSTKFKIFLCIKNSTWYSYQKHWSLFFNRNKNLKKIEQIRFK